jgi:histidine triad (HIT) family protein
MIPFALKRAVFYGYKKGMMRMFGCLFCQIVEGQRPSKLLFEDSQCMAFDDIHPKAPVHFLVIPRKHIASLNDPLDTGDEALIGHLLSVGAKLAKEKGIDGTGYRTVINTNAEAGQTVFHLHVHIMGGRILRWPPG